MPEKTMDVWACDHLWEEWDKDSEAAKDAIEGLAETHLIDGNYDYDIPACDKCEKQRLHVSVSRRSIPHPWQGL